MMISGNTDIGKVRTSNQDSFASGVFPDHSAWVVVCDGMGGANGGQIASSVAVETIRKRFELLEGSGMDSRSIRNTLLCACEAANAEIYERAQENHRLSGMGTTIVAAIILDKTAHILHVGDSRAYYIDYEGITRITRDHSMVQELFDSGEISEEEARVHPQKNIITKALGISDSLSYDYNETELTAGSKLLFCTDGLTNMITDADLYRLIKSTNNADKLIEKALDEGGTDNVTAVLVYDI